MSLKLHEVAKEIRDINRTYLKALNSFNSQQQDNWYNKQFSSNQEELITDIQVLYSNCIFHKLQNFKADKMISDYMTVESIAKSRYYK